MSSVNDRSVRQPSPAISNQATNVQSHRGYVPAALPQYKALPVLRRVARTSANRQHQSDVSGDEARRHARRHRRNYRRQRRLLSVEMQNSNCNNNVLGLSNRSTSSYGTAIVVPTIEVPTVPPAQLQQEIVTTASQQQSEEQTIAHVMPPHNEQPDAYLGPISNEQAPCSAHIARIVVTDEGCPVQSIHSNVTGEESRPQGDTISSPAVETSGLMTHISSSNTVTADSHTMANVGRVTESQRQTELPLQASSLETHLPSVFSEVCTQNCETFPEGEPPPYYMESPLFERRRAPHRSRSRRPSERRHNSYRYDPHDEPEAKLCCDRRACRICLSACLKFRRVLIMLVVIGICCLLTGVVLGVLQSPGSSYLTLALMFAGLGVMLMIVVMIGWKCTPPDHEPCHLLFGLGAYSMVTRRGARRRRERYYWVGGMLYSEFRHRRPPPSYSTSMQDYHNAVARRIQGTIPNSPPPTYKSHSSVGRPGVHIIFPRSADHPNSRPPTYRQINHIRPSIDVLNETNQTHNVESQNAQVDMNSSHINLTAAEVHSNNQAQDSLGITNPSFTDEEQTVALSANATDEVEQQTSTMGSTNCVDRAVHENVSLTRQYLTSICNSSEVTEL